MNADSRVMPRKQARFEVRMPIRISGIDRDGHYFNAPAETLNGSSEGLGLLLDRELYPFTFLVISIPRDQQVLQIQTEVRHITTFDDKKKLVGVRFRKIVVV